MFQLYMTVGSIQVMAPLCSIVPEAVTQMLGVWPMIVSATKCQLGTATKIVQVSKNIKKRKGAKINISKKTKKQNTNCYEIWKPAV